MNKLHKTAKHTKTIYEKLKLGAIKNSVPILLNLIYAMVIG